MILPIIKKSLNSIYSGMHWKKRADLKDAYLSLLRNKLSVLEPVTRKVDLNFTFYFKTTPLDSSNCAFMVKMIEDCLVHYGVLKNDTIEYVGKVSMQSVKIKGDNDYCELEII